MLICAPCFCAPVASAGAAQKLKGPACPSSTTGLVMKKRAVCLATPGVVEAQASTRISASYRTTDPGLPETAGLCRGCLGLPADSIRWTHSASVGDTPRMRAVSRRVGNGVLIVTRCLTRAAMGHKHGVSEAFLNCSQKASGFVSTCLEEETGCENSI